MPSSGGEAADGTRGTQSDEVAAEGPDTVVKQMDAELVPQATDDVGAEAVGAATNEGPPAPGLDQGLGSSGGSAPTNPAEVSADS